MNSIPLYLVLLALNFSLPTSAIFSKQDVDICRDKFELARKENLSARPIGEVVTVIGKSFIGVNYAAHTLETEGEERLVIHLTGLDCYTYLESVLVLSRLIKTFRMTFEDYQKELLHIRYRQGVIRGYPSRLHYFSDWLYEMARLEVGRDMTREIGGLPYRKKISFMSDHPDRYPPLKRNSQFLEEIKKIERAISVRQYYYVPREKIALVEGRIKSGDIIGITTSIAGLDISHTGIAVLMDNGRIHLMHAPGPGQRVQISDVPLADYVAANKKHTGVMVLRPLEPKEIEKSGRN